MGIELTPLKRANLYIVYTTGTTSTFNIHYEVKWKKQKFSFYLLTSVKKFIQQNSPKLLDSSASPFPALTADVEQG